MFAYSLQVSAIRPAHFAVYSVGEKIF